MRNGQQKRMRGRNNRRSSNPLTRVYESNGPDVKVRGTAHHIAEKYQQLARDAQSSGDPVAAENYLQHAEHYLRLIASLQGTFSPQLGFGRDDEMDEEDMDDVAGLDAPQPYPRQEPQQPYGQREGREPREGREGREPRENREPREPRGENRREGRQQGGYRRNRDEDAGEPPPRDYRSNRASREDNGEAAAYAPAPRSTRGSRNIAEEAEAPRAARAERTDEEQDIGLPAFITGTPPLAKERSEPKADQEEPAAEETADAAEGRVTRRRRRFRTRAERAEEAEAGEAPLPEQQALFGE